jgi:uncharacterized membrane protein
MVSIGVLSLVVVPWIRRYIYEVCIKLHFVIGVFSIVMIWIYMKDRYGLNGWLLICLVAVLLLNTFFYTTRELFRNITRKQFLITG